MRVGSQRVGVAAAVLILAVLVPWSGAQPRNAPKDDKAPDLAEFIDLGKYYVKPVSPKKDEKTGFVVGGRKLCPRRSIWTAYGSRPVFCTALPLRGYADTQETEHRNVRVSLQFPEMYGE